MDQTAFVSTRCTLSIASFKVFHWQTTINSIAQFCNNSDTNYSVFLVAYEVVEDFQEELRHASSLENSKLPDNIMVIHCIKVTTETGLYK